MRILSRYFVGSYLAYYAAIIVLSMLVIAMIEMMVNFDHAIEYGDGLRGAATYLFLRLPSYYLPFVLPVGSYGATFLSLGLPARALEILAAKTSGISPRRIAAPVLVTAAAFSLVALVANETIVLGTARRLNHQRDGGEVVQSRGSFWYQRGTTLFNVEVADRDAHTLQGVAIYERDRDGRLVRSVHADEAHVEDGHRWRLERALFREFSRDDPEAAPRTEARETAWFDLGVGGDLTLLDADPRSLSLVGLRDYIRAIDREGRTTTRYRAMWNARLADPFTVLLFALLAIPIALSVERTRAIAIAAVQGIAWLAVYYAFQMGVAAAGSGGLAMAVFAPWAVFAGFGAFAAWRFARMSA